MTIFIRLTISLFLIIASVEFAIAQNNIADNRTTALEPTKLIDVLNSAREFYPSIQSAQQRIRETEADSLSALGSFDSRLDGGISSRIDSYYDGNSAGAGLYKNLPFMGAEVFSEYSRSNGSFPIYEDSLITADDGKIKLGFALSLLRDREIDDPRFGVLKAQLETNIAEFNLQTQELSIFQQAFIAYSRWLISARLLEAYNELLNVAVVRGDAMETQVAAGDLAEIFLVENRQAILQREGLVVDARRQLDLSAEILALFLRDEDGLPLYPVYDEVLLVPEADESFLDAPISQLVDTTLTIRPDIASARILQEQFQLERRLAENLIKPQLDLKVYTSRNFGNSPMVSVLGNENVVELAFSVPLQTRNARGRIASADARLAGLSYDLQLLIDQAERDIRSSLVNLTATTELKQVALEELEVAQLLAEAEERRFLAGISDYFTLNVRERMLGEAQLKRWQAELNHQVALANYYGISLDLPELDSLVQ